MNLILLFETDFTASGRVVLKDQRHQHLATVLGTALGQTLRVGLLGGQLGTATVVAHTRELTELEVSLCEAPPAKLPLTLLLALPRPKVLRRVIRSCTELGIEHIILINSWRVEKSFWQSPLLAADAILQSCYLGLQQARDTVLPRISIEQRFKPFVEDRLPQLLHNTSGLLAHPGNSQACPTAPAGKVVLAIGPEGGFIPYEVDMLLTAGMHRVHFGPRILRVENAVSAITGHLYGANTATDN